MKNHKQYDGNVKIEDLVIAYFLKLKRDGTGRSCGLTWMAGTTAGGGVGK
jgi:hypothetical protein